MGYGILNGSMGFGAVIGATNLPRVRRVLSADAIIAWATGVFVATLAALALVKVPLIIIPMLIAGGFAWTSAMSTLNLAVQVSVPAWVQARALGAYQMIFAGGMALGGVIWGFIAEHVSTSKSLMCAAAGLAVTLPFSLRFHVLRGVQPDFSPHLYSAAGTQAGVGTGRQRRDRFGCRSITISIRGTTPPLPRPFIKLRDVRLRDGAIRWGVYQDASDPGHHQRDVCHRIMARVPAAAGALHRLGSQTRDLVWSFHRGNEPPRISHMFYAKEVSDPQETSRIDRMIAQQLKPALLSGALEPFHADAGGGLGSARAAPMGFQADGVVIAILRQGAKLAHPVNDPAPTGAHSYFLPGWRTTSFAWQ
jgi:hypothetical protein